MSAKRLAAVVERQSEIDTEIQELRALEQAATEETPLPDDHEERVDVLLAEYEELETERKPLQEREDKITAIRSKVQDGTARLEHGDDRSAPQHMKRTETEVDFRTAGRSDIRSAALKTLETEHRSGAVEVSDESAAHVEKLFGAYRVSDDGDVITDGTLIAKRMLITETPAYRSAFQKALKGQSNLWTAEEQASMMRAAEQSLTNASGGFAVPVLIDPTVILTSGGASAPVVQLARVEPITNNAWKGVSSAGVTFENLAENTAATAKQATLAQPVVTAHKIACFIPYSLEIEGDWPNFAGEMQALIETAYVDYLAEKTITGTGTIEMFGIVTAIDATSGSEVAVTTDGALGPEDAFVLWNALGERARGRSNWLSHVSVESKIRQSANNGGLYTVSMAEDGIGVVNGKRWYTSEYAASFTGTTGPANLAVLGDFQRYVLAQRVGMNIELIPHVVDGSGLPKGQRGWFAWARVGGDSIDDGSFRLLQNQ